MMLWARADGGNAIVHAWGAAPFSICKRVQMIAESSDVVSPIRRCKLCLRKLGLLPKVAIVSRRRFRVRTEVMELLVVAKRESWSAARLRREIARRTKPARGRKSNRRMWLDELRRAGCPISHLPDHRQIELPFGAAS